MLDPTEQRKNGFRAAADRFAERLARRGAVPAAPVPLTPRAPRASRLSLASLYERFDAMVGGRAHDDDSELHAAILARLAANRRHAEDAGWTAFALECDTGTGRIRLVGVAPSAHTPTIVPDWTASVAADALVRRRRGC